MHYFITFFTVWEYYIARNRATAQFERWFFMNTSLVCIDVYTISEGDTLYSIAEKYDLPVSLLMKVNEIDNPYNLQIGTRLCIPGTEDQLPQAPEECFDTYTVVPGDTLYLIAKKHGVKLDNLMRSNPNIDPYNLLIGTELCIPAEG